MMADAGSDFDTSTSVGASKVDIVTVNWNAGHQLRECIASVQEYDEGIVRRFIVVDNASRDGSADFPSDWPKLAVDRTNANLGFGRACNRGVKQGDAPFILLLNPDTRLSEPAISKAVAFLETPEGKRFGVCGIKLLNEAGDVTRHCARFPSLATFAAVITGFDKISPRLIPGLLMADFDHLTSRSVDHVQGAFYLIRRELFESVGGFDDDYFVYLEDLDLSLKVKQAGYDTYYLAEANAFHRGGGTSQQVKGIARFYGIEARLLYAQKHLGPIAQAIHTAMTFVIEPPATLLWHLVKYRGQGLGGVLDAFRRLYGNMPGVVRGVTARARGETAEAQARPLGSLAQPGKVGVYHRPDEILE